MVRLIVPAPTLPSRAPDISGTVFGRLTVIGYAGRLSDFHGRRWLCRCECGNLVVITKACLDSGNTVSCGCFALERRRTHGMTRTKEYECWRGMMKRCFNPKDAGYRKYGGRGITVCDRWRRFENFYADMGPRPSSDHSIERRDCNGPYSPENCRWATRLEQAQNTRRNVRITFKGETKTAAEWGRALGINANTIHWRLRMGRTPEEALKAPKKKSLAGAHH